MRKLSAEQRKAIAIARRNGELLKVIAHRFGVSIDTVANVCQGYGIRRIPKYEQIVNYAIAHPAASAQKIADHFNTSRRAVEVILSQHGLSRGVVALGRAARSAGLTVADLRAIAAERRAQ